MTTTRHDPTWHGTRCPRCGKPWPVESIRQDCLRDHGPNTPTTTPAGRTRPAPHPDGTERITGL